MKLGCVTDNIVRTFRYLRGSHVLKNKFGNVTAQINTHGGLAFLFELNYEAKSLTFAPAINMEEEAFEYFEGRRQCIHKAESGKAYTIPYDAGVPLLDQVYRNLVKAKSLGELERDTELHTLLKRIEKYDSQNCATSQLLAELAE